MMAQIFDIWEKHVLLNRGICHILKIYAARFSYVYIIIQEFL